MYDLDFDPEFFLAEGEPCDRSNNAVNADGNPISVWSAIAMMAEDDWKNLAEIEFGIDPDLLSPETVFDMIKETNTCSNLNSPIEVWIDPNGSFTLKVYDGPDAT